MGNEVSLCSIMLPPTCSLSPGDERSHHSVNKHVTVTVGMQGHPKYSLKHLGIEKADLEIVHCDTEAKTLCLRSTGHYQWVYFSVKVKITTTGLSGSL